VTRSLPDPQSKDPRKRLRGSFSVAKRPASIWTLIAILTLLIGFIAYSTFNFYQDVNAPTPYASSSETMAGLAFSWAGSLMEGGLKILAAIFLIPLLFVMLGLLITGLIGVLIGRKWSLIYLGVFTMMLTTLSVLLFLFGMMNAAFITLFTVTSLLVTINLPDTKVHWKS
jgi:hypothetical protein